MDREWGSQTFFIRTPRRLISNWFSKFCKSLTLKPESSSPIICLYLWSKNIGSIILLKHSLSLTCVSLVRHLYEIQETISSNDYIFYTQNHYSVQNFCSFIDGSSPIILQPHALSILYFLWSIIASVGEKLF